jgi:CubicO group peptidase (beta-lactamase class C family)
VRLVTEIHGGADEDFGAVADAFRSNFDQRGELGAAFALYVDGRLVADLWGGVADASTGRPWDRDTLQLVFSTTKGMTAICVAKLVAEGLLDYDAPVATYWPEFAANGKGEITLGQLMSHQAGIPYVDAPLTRDEVLAVQPAVDALAAQAPYWEPGTAHGYHAVTYGWLAGEVVRRVDGRRLGRYFAEELAAPLGLETWIGLPEALEPRVSRLESVAVPDDPGVRALMAQFLGPTTPLYRALTMSGALGGFDVDAPAEADNPYNSPEVHASEIPAANGITTARSLAKLYAATVSEVDGIRVLDPAIVESARTERVHAPDRVLIVPTRFGAGFMLDSTINPLLSGVSFGHPGAGGSLGYADPEARVGYGYVMNRMGGAITGDPRTVVLNDAIRAALG